MAGRWDIPVPEREAYTRARGLRPRRADQLLTIAKQTVLPSDSPNSVGALNEGHFAAQYPAHVHPCQRFAAALTENNA